MKQVHCDLIKAWADGAKIEIFTEHEGWQEARNPSFYENRKYRIKPEVKKYRVSLNTFENRLPYTLSIDKVEQVSLTEQSPQFIKWLTDWIEYTE